jgi:hypothetical protein
MAANSQLRVRGISGLSVRRQIFREPSIIIVLRGLFVCNIAQPTEQKIYVEGWKKSTPSD